VLLQADPDIKFSGRLGSSFLSPFPSIFFRLQNRTRIIPCSPPSCLPPLFFRAVNSGEFIFPRFFFITSTRRTGALRKVGTVSQGQTQIGFAILLLTHFASLNDAIPTFPVLPRGFQLIFLFRVKKPLRQLIDSPSSQSVFTFSTLQFPPDFLGQLTFFPPAV